MTKYYLQQSPDSSGQPEKHDDPDKPVDPRPGAAFGGGTGAAIGAGSGLVVGGLVGTSSASTSGKIGQQRYDLGYTQCMYEKGHHVPISGQIAQDPRNRPPGASPESISNPSSIPSPPPPAN